MLYSPKTFELVIGACSFDPVDKSLLGGEMGGCIGQPVRDACSARSVVVLRAMMRISAGTFSPTRTSTMSPGSSSLAGNAAICTRHEQ